MENGTRKDAIKLPRLVRAIYETVVCFAFLGFLFMKDLFFGHKAPFLVGAKRGCFFSKVSKHFVGPIEVPENILGLNMGSGRIKITK